MGGHYTPEFTVGQTGCYLGLSNNPKYRVWVDTRTSQELKEAESKAEDDVDLACQLFTKIFQKELEEMPDSVYCTDVEGKEKLNEAYMNAIHCKL